MPVSIRGGGHNVAGHAVCDGGVMIDLSLMCGVRVDPERRRAWVEGGATWADVDRETQAFGLATPGGLISDTGVAGPRSAAASAGCAAAAACASTIDGGRRRHRRWTPVHAGAAENADLLWALKGGGGNFGVVTMFEFALHPVGPKMMFCAPIYPLEAGGGPIRFWRDFLRDKNDDVGSLIEFSTIPPDPAFPREAWGKRVYTMAGGLRRRCRGGREAAATPARAGGAGDRFLRPDGLLRDAEALRCHHPLRSVPVLLEEPLPERADRCSDRADRCGQRGSALAEYPVVDLELRRGDRARRAGRHGLRRPLHALYVFHRLHLARGRGRPDQHRVDAGFWKRMEPHSHHGRIYLSFPGLGEEGERLLRDSFGPNYARLQAIKRKYDPGNLFRFNQNIQPAA
jgi:hypothetical protein